MPEIGMPKTEFAHEIRETTRSKNCNLWPHEIEAIASNNSDQEIIGSGAECVVVPGKDHSKDVVLAYTYFDMNPLRAKEIFYSQRIFSTLFPHNFPHFYAAFGRHPEVKKAEEATNPSGTIRQRIYQEGQEINEIKFPFERVKEICHEIGLPIFAEDSPQNMKIGDDGGEYYLDVLRHLDPAAINEDRLFECMQEQGYSEIDMHAVRISIGRLKEVYIQAAKQREESGREDARQSRRPMDFAFEQKMAELMRRIQSGEFQADIDRSRGFSIGPDGKIIFEKQEENT